MGTIPPLSSQLIGGVKAAEGSTHGQIKRSRTANGTNLKSHQESKTASGLCSRWRTSCSAQRKVWKPTPSPKGRCEAAVDPGLPCTSVQAQHPGELLGGAVRERL